MRRSILGIVLIALFAAACAGSGSSDTVTSLPPAIDAGGGSETFDKGIAPGPIPGPVNGDGSALVVTSSISIVVDDLDAAIADARATVRALGGTLVGISRGSDGLIYREDGSYTSAVDGPATLSFRIPAASLEGAIDTLRSLGEVTSERTDASDVSASLRDLGARLKNLRSAEANYQRLLDRAESITDLLAITAQLDMVRGQIEQLAAEQASLDDAVERSTLALTLYPPATPLADASEGFDPGRVVEEASGTLLTVAIGILTFVIYALVLGLPALVLLLIGYRLFGDRLRARLVNGRTRPRR